MKTDSELIEVFKKFEERVLDNIVFEIEKTCYIPIPSARSSSTPNAHPQVLH